MKKLISEIVIGERHRKDMGDLNTLANSILDVGLLQPIGVTEDNVLIFGERRLQACRDLLGWKEIEVRVLDMPRIVVAENAENEVRKAFTASERVAIAQAIEAEISERRGRPSEKKPQNIAGIPKGEETRDFAAKKAGFGNRETYRQAKEVVDRAEPELVDAMDDGKVSVLAAHRASKLEPEKQRALASGRSSLDEMEFQREDDKRRRAEALHPKIKVQSIVDGTQMIAHAGMTPEEFLATAPPVTVNRFRRAAIGALAFLRGMTEVENDKTGTR